LTGHLVSVWGGEVRLWIICGNGVVTIRCTALCLGDDTINRNTGISIRFISGFHETAQIGTITGVVHHECNPLQGTERI
jgi:hypothetical protein